MPTNNKGLKELWGYPLIDEKARNAISDTRSSLENDFQKKTDDTLGTVDKTVPGAINEIKNNIDTIGDNFSSEQTETKYDMKYNGKSIGSIGIELKDNQIAGGDGSFNIDLTPYQTKTDTSLTTNDKTISGAIKELNTQCKDIVNKVENVGNANKVKIADAGSYFTDKTVEGALQEVGTQIKNVGNKADSRGVNILNFGAVPNDENFDNYTHIMEAIKYAVTNGINAVFIPSGTWHIKQAKPIYLPSNFTLFGAGYTSIVKKSLDSYVSGNRENANNYANNSIISQGDPVNLNVSYKNNAESQNICIHDICVDGSVLKDTDFSHLTNLSEMYGLGINLTYSIQPKIYNVEVKNTANSGIYMFRTWGANISNCDLHHCGTNLAFDGTTRNGISMTGKEVSGLKANSIDSCRLYENGDMGIQMCYTPCNVTNNVIYDNDGSGIEDDSSFYTNEELGGFIVSNNYIRNNKGYGMNLSGSGYATRIISNNVVMYCEQGGIYIADDIKGASTKDNTLITNNIIQKCKTKVDYVHLITYSGSGVCTVSHNHIIENEPLDKEISCNGNTINILNNTINNNSTGGGIYVNAAKAVVDGNHYDNVGHKRLIISGNVDYARVSNNYFNIGTCFLDLDVTKLDTFIYENNTIVYNTNESSFASDINTTNTFTIDYMRIANNHLKVPSDWTCGRFIEFGKNITLDKVIYTTNDFLDKYASWGKMVNFTNTPTVLVDANNIKAINAEA